MPSAIVLAMLPAICSNMGMNIQDEISLAVRFYLEIAVEYFQLNLPELPIKFTLVSDIDLAYFCYHERGNNAEQCWFEFNPIIAQQNKEVYLQGVVPHEVAHYVERVVYGTHNPDTHDREWRNIMELLFGVEARITYDI